MDRVFYSRRVYFFLASLLCLFTFLSAIHDVSARKVCCVCEYDTSEPRFLQACQRHILENPECAWSQLRPLTNGNPRGPVCAEDIPRDCASIDYTYNGHSNPLAQNPWLARMTQLCVYCPDVEGRILGCATFENPLDAQRRLQNLRLRPGTHLELWGSQCVTNTEQAQCSLLGCTLTYGCSDIQYDQCPTTDEYCYLAHSSCQAITCQETNGSLGQRTCCGPADTRAHNIPGIGDTGFWRRPSQCTSRCNGACCVAETGQTRCTDQTGVGPRDQYRCSNEQGVWKSGEQCGPQTCGQLGACCLTDWMRGERQCFASTLEQKCIGAGNAPGYSSRWVDGRSCGEVSQCQTAGVCCSLMAIGGEDCQPMANEAACLARRGTGTGPVRILDVQWHEGAYCWQGVCNWPTGACCIEYVNGTHDCTSHVEEARCSDRARDVDVRNIIWNQGLTCDQVDCFPVTGACCRTHADGTFDCDPDKTEKQCNQLADDEGAIDHAWHEGKTCEEVNCGTGACCITIEGGGSVCSAPVTQCYSRLTELRCKLTTQHIIEETGKTAGYQWHFDQTCAEVNCANGGCQAHYPGAYRAEDQETCKRYFCPWTDPDFCWAWFSERDEEGCVCCGPA